VVGAPVRVAILFDPHGCAAGVVLLHGVSGAVARAVALDPERLAALRVDLDPAIGPAVAAGVLFAPGQATLGVVVAPAVDAPILIGVEFDARESPALVVFGAVGRPGPGAVDAATHEHAVGLGCRCAG